jgi:HEAT repeat protein
VLYALGKIGPAAKPAVPVLVKAVGGSCEQCRNAAIFALGEIGPGAKEAKAVLVKNLGSDDEFLATISAWALARIDCQCAETAPKTVPLLVKALANDNPQIRLEAAESLRCLGPLAKPAAPALKKALEDDDELVSEMAAEALKAIGK